ncbi:MAG TPA: hypothetical protein VES95_08495, partial [Dermatophilaceae bacterium]|nr:hypothetical protein [Dermatophilaceae bacterium]
MADPVRPVRVTRAQRNAARLLVELAEERGEPVADSVRLIAAAAPPQVEPGPSRAVRPNGAAVGAPAGSRPVLVTRAQRDAARALVEMAEARGEQVAESLRAIAAARS